MGLRAAVALGVGAAVALGGGGRGASADQIDLAVGAGFGSGLSLGTGEKEAVIHRTPLFVEADVSGWLDIYPGWECTVAVVLPIEDAPALGLTPRLVRVIRRWQVHGYLALGVPLYLTPYTLFGAEVAVGARHPTFTLLDPELTDVEVFATVSADAFLAGSDLPLDGTLVMFNLVAGVRVPL